MGRQQLLAPTFMTINRASVIQRGERTAAQGQSRRRSSFSKRKTRKIRTQRWAGIMAIGDHRKLPVLACDSCIRAISRLLRSSSCSLRSSDMPPSSSGRAVSLAGTAVARCCVAIRKGRWWFALKGLGVVALQRKELAKVCVRRKSKDRSTRHSSSNSGAHTAKLKDKPTASHRKGRA